MLISIIIPIYNSEKYLKNCLDSLLQQSFENFEALLINDGSTDRSDEICDEYAEKDSRFKVYHKGNSGVSAARNFGLEKAQGEWIWFVDSDDYIRNDALDVLQSAIEKNDTDSMMFGYQKINLIGKSIYQFPEKGNTILLNQSDALKNLYKSSFYPYQGYVWSKVFKKSVINDFGIRFDENIYFNEDRLFCFEYFSKTKKNITYILEDLYFYLEAPDSAMNLLTKAYNPKFETDIQAYLLMQEIVKKGNFKKMEKYARLGNIFSAKRLLEMRKGFQIPANDFDQYLCSILVENFKIRDYLGRNVRLGYFNWRFIKSIKN